MNNEDTSIDSTHTAFTSTRNIYHLDEVEVELATIHSVKGETHIATLYLETYYDKQHEGDRLKKQLEGKPIKKSPGIRICEASKMARSEERRVGKEC